MGKPIGNPEFIHVTPDLNKIDLNFYIVNHK